MSGKKQNEGSEHTQLTNDPGRSVAEWASLGVSLTILFALIGLVLYAYLGDVESPPVIEVQPQLGQVRSESGSFYLPLEIKNTGGLTAQEINIEITLAIEDGPKDSVFLNLPFLAGGEIAHGIVVFSQDPTRGELSTAVSFLEP